MAKRYGNKTKAKTAKVMRSLEYLCETPVDVNTEVCCMSFLISLQFSLNACYSFWCQTFPTAPAVFCTCLFNVDPGSNQRDSGKRWCLRKTGLLCPARCCSSVCRRDCRWNPQRNTPRVSLSRWEQSAARCGWMLYKETLISLNSFILT